MNYVKAILSIFAAIFLVKLGPGFWSLLRVAGEQKATGAGAVAGALIEGIFSPLFWSFVVLFSVLFLAASRLGNSLLRIILFWIPTVFLSVAGFAFVGIWAYILVHYRHR